MQDEGTVKNDQGTVQFDQVQVEYCHITAPISRASRSAAGGSRKPRAAGASVSSNANPLVVITQIQPITVIFTLPEDRIGEVQAQLRKDANAHRRRLRSLRPDENRQRQAAGAGQPDRHHDGNGEGARGFQ